MKQELVSSHILEQAPYKLKRFCDRCGRKLIPLHGTFHNYCPICNQSAKNIFDLNPTFEITQKLISGEFSKQIFKARIQTKKFDREQLVRNIRDQLILEWHRSGIFTYNELEIVFGIKTRRLHELSNKDYHGLLTKNCEICGKVMEFGDNVYLYEQKRFCSPKCKSQSRRKHFRYLHRMKMIKETKKSERIEIFIAGEHIGGKGWEDVSNITEGVTNH